MLELYEQNDGNRFKEQRGTAYNLLNAVTQFVDHERSTRGNGVAVDVKRSESALFGSGEDLKTDALDAMLALVGSN